MCVWCVGWAFGFFKSLLAVNLAAPDSPAEPAQKLPRNPPRARARNSRGISRPGPGPKLPGNLLRARDPTSCGIWPDPAQGLRFAPKTPTKYILKIIIFRPYTHLYSNHSHARSAREIFLRFMPTPSSFPLHARSARKFLRFMPTPSSFPLHARSTRKFLEALPTPNFPPLHARSARNFLKLPTPSHDFNEYIHIHTYICIEYIHLYKYIYKNIICL